MKKHNKIRTFAVAIVLLVTLIAVSVLAVNVLAAEDVNYIYFDLAAGNITINGKHYSGSAYKKDANGNYSSVQITGDWNPGQVYYVYQSVGGPTKPDGYFEDDANGNRVFTLPVRTPVTYNGKSWGNYITNHPADWEAVGDSGHPKNGSNSVKDVITAWTSAVGTARTDTGNNITFSGNVGMIDMVLDNIWSSYQGTLQSRQTGSIGYATRDTQYANNHITLKFKGDNRLANVYYNTVGALNSSTFLDNNNRLIFDTVDDDPDATLTVANNSIDDIYKGGQWWNAAIGSSDSHDPCYGLVFNGGVIYAGTTAYDDCTAIGGGGNGAAHITINGATITAVASTSGSAIGGGIGKTAQGGSAKIFIEEGSNVFAYNFGYGGVYGYGHILSSAIGGGSSSEAAGCALSEVTIKGGYVYAQSVGGTAIGVGSSTKTTGGSSTVTISGKAEVHAYSIAGKLGGVDVLAGAGIGGGTGGTGPTVDGAPLNADGGSVTLTIEGDAKVYTGSVGGGSTNDTKSKIGHAVITISGNATVSGQFIMAEGANEHCSFTMSGGLIDNTGRKASDFLKKDGGAVYMDDAGLVSISGGTIKKCSGELGGAIYMTAGAFNLSENGRITECTATNSGGAVYLGGGVVNISGGSIINNTAAQNGGGVAISSGTFNLSGTGEIYQCTATNSGGAVYLGGGAVNISGGSIINNTAALNGGGVAITNGNYTMTGGAVNSNKAQTGNGGGIYVSSTSSSKILIRSGEVSHNTAGNGGGALGVHGPGTAAFTIQIGSNTDHNVPNATGQCHYYDSIEESCPVIINNKSHKVGGGIYLSGSYDAKLLMYCIVESGNEADGGASSSNFMKVEGGTLTIATRGENDELGPGFGKIVIKNSVHVTGGKVELRGLGDNPQFNDKITVDVTGDSYFHDLRDKTTSPAFTVQYFENFEENGVKSGQYISMDVPKDALHIVQAGLYSHDGFLLKAWTLMMPSSDPNNPHTPSNEAFRVNLGLQGDKETYAGNDPITVKGDIILYAKWEAAGYSIIFLPGVDSYGGTMNQLDLSYTQEANLTPNAFTNVGYIFKNWKRADADEIYYSDGQAVSKLTDVDGAEIKLIAQWEICYHTNSEAYSLSSTDDSISRECNCLGYTETAKLESFTVTYDGAQHPARLTCSAKSENGITPDAAVWNIWDESDFSIGYSGKNWGETKDWSGVPCNAGNYTVTISYPTLNPVVFASVNVIINKKDQLPPPVPQYVTEKINDKMSIIVQDGYKERLEYTFTWYDEDTNQYMSNPVRWTNPNVTPVQQLDRIYTNYYVSVKFVGDDNHNPSVDVKGTWVVVYTGGVSFSFSADAGMLCQDAAGEADSGLVVTLTPQPGYYIYNVQISQMSSSKGSEYELPKYEHTLTLRDQWKVRFFDIKTLTDKDTVNIYVHFTGAELIPTIEADTVKDQVFSSIYNKGEANVSISRDSAYTVRFDVDNYKYYSNPVISFDTALPSGTTLVMMDQNDSSYWGYTVGASPVPSVPLSNFVRMGGVVGTDQFVVDGRTSFDLQFVVDFSRCATPLDPTIQKILTAKFYATPIHPQQSIQTVPSLPSEGDAISTVTLQAIPGFTVERITSEELLTEKVLYQYANSVENIGISKWQSRKGVLVITPSETLPADARLQVTIGNSTNIYGLKDGRYIVALPSGNSGEVSITFLSDMVPVGQQTYNFSVKFYASETLVGSTPESIIAPLDGKLSYTVTKSAPIELKAQITSTSSLPQFIPKDENGKPSITSLGYSVSTSVLPSGYSVKATLYGKNPDGKGYSATTQSSTLDFSEGTEFTLELASLAEGMTTKLGSLSMMLRIEVLDSNGKVVTYYPLYFIVVDPR